MFLTAAVLAITIAGERICAERNVNVFYARRENRLAWNDASIAALEQAIDDSEADGLDPDDYHRRALRSVRGERDRDILATDAFLLLAQHLSEGRVNPQSLIREWCIPPKRMDLAAALQTALDADDITGVLQKLTPQHAGYVRLRAALQTYRDIERSGGWPGIAGGPALRRGDSGARVLQLRQRLAREPRDVEMASSFSDVFEEHMEASVRHFQSRHGLTADGVVGRATLQELNVPASQRVEQIALNMERWRWMPERLGDPYALLNIAAFQLDVIENGRSVLSMKTIVGKNFWETPFFPATISDIVINPSWFVPDAIAGREIWPHQRRDHSYLKRNHYEIQRGGTLRQLPGPWNPLGRIKFNMPNRFSVYLHDTPAKELFNLDSRAFSHGCIRLERSFDLALYILRNQPEWGFAALGAAIATEKEQTIHVANPVPVYVLYWTAWAAEDGDVAFHRDVYKRDAALAAALRSPVTISR
ncbi:MAG TPA: L,D-transpeptidase family protein [Rhodanobacteraceae bacterium]